MIYLFSDIALGFFCFFLHLTKEGQHVRGDISHLPSSLSCYISYLDCIIHSFTHYASSPSMVINLVLFYASIPTEDLSAEYLQNNAYPSISLSVECSGLWVIDPTCCYCFTASTYKILPISLFTVNGSNGIGLAVDDMDKDVERKTICTSAVVFF